MLQERKPNLTPTKLYNPTLEDFTCTFADDNNHPIPYTLHAQEIEEFPGYIADHIKKMLSMKIYNEKYSGIKTREAVMPDILKEIEVTL